MRGISGNESPPHAILLRSSSIDFEGRDPAGIAEGGVTRPALVEGCLEVRQGQVSPDGRLLRFHDDPVPILAGQGNREEQSSWMDEAVQLVMPQAPVELGIG